jgi:hypothetical protein
VLEDCFKTHHTLTPVRLHSSSGREGYNCRTASKDMRTFGHDGTTARPR